MSNSKEVFCDYCGKHNDFVETMIAGVKGHICDECVELCVKLIEERRKEKNENLK